jgi:hypothetical protein
VSNEIDPLVAAQNRIAELEERNRASIRSEAIAGALAGHDLNPGAAAQIAELIAKDVVLAKGPDGKDVAVNKSFQPIAAHVNDVLGRPEYQHFLRPKGSPPPAAASRPPTQSPGDASWDPLHPNETLSERMIRVSQARRATEPADPRLSATVGFGLRPRR